MALKLQRAAPPAPSQGLRCLPGKDRLPAVLILSALLSQRQNSRVAEAHFSTQPPCIGQAFYHSFGKPGMLGVPVLTVSQVRQAVKTGRCSHPTPCSQSRSVTPRKLQSSGSEILPRRKGRSQEPRALKFSQKEMTLFGTESGEV